MEEKKVKLSTVIIFLLLIVIIAGGVYIYKIKSKDVNISDKPSESQNTEIAEEAKTKPTETEGNNTGTSTKVELSDQEKFDKYMQEYKKSMEKVINERFKGDDVIEVDNNIIDTYSLDFYQPDKSNKNDAFFELDKNGSVNLTINKSSELYSKYGSKYKIAENIASMYMCQVGQDDNFDLVMLGFDGSAKSLDISKDNLLKEIKIKDMNAKYAINVFPYINGAGTYGIVDINGNIITK